MFPILKYQMSREMNKLGQTTAIGESLLKKQKSLFCTPVSKFQKISTLNICDGAKSIYPRKQNSF